jgi:hypothetical protein
LKLPFMPTYNFNFFSWTGSLFILFLVLISGSLHSYWKRTISFKSCSSKNYFFILYKRIFKYSIFKL